MNILSPQESISKGYRRVQIDHNSYHRFLNALEVLVSNIQEQGQSEEQQKNILTRFLHDAFYASYDMSAVDNIDLAIRMNESSSSNVGIMFEVKGIGRPDMPTLDNLNTKAIRELLLYYLRQRKAGNIDIRHLIITNTREYFIFDAQEFERYFYNDRNLLRQFDDFEQGRLTGTSTNYFYSEIAAPAISQIIDRIKFTYFSLRDYTSEIHNRAVSGKLTHLYRVLSPIHLLKLPFQNDSNSLNDQFYRELLHLIGLEEFRDGGKVIIRRKELNHRESSSLLENALSIIETYSPSLASVTGSTRNERFFNAAMELCIIWINRILFLKLLEAQLLNYHNGNADYQFLNYNKIPDFDGLNRLFFQVMAIEPTSRNSAIKNLFPKVPYLNSSLFEQTELERNCIRISELEQSSKLTIMNRSILKNDPRFKDKRELPFLEYLFAFLDAYNFSSEGIGEVAEKPKTLINASVLGLIFEKINGYKDGAVFTPGFITRYICSFSIRAAVIEKFNEYYGWEITDFEQLINADYDHHTANDLVNSLKILDPAVGSGHFLVSALNEIILIKSQLGCLFDSSGRRIKSTHYEISIENDDLIIIDEEGELWSYNPNLPESRRIQEALFKEKRTIIENCLFGVDINPNSVNICRLRLWIELLKNAYYTSESNYTQLETLPNIDINIKCGNSVLQKFGLNDKLVNQNIKKYRDAVKNYKRTKTKEDKYAVEQLITTIKNEIVSNIYERSPEMVRYKQAEMHYHKLAAARMFDDTRTSIVRRKDEKRLKDAKRIMDRAKQTLDAARSNQIYRGGFEWRMEFPEVLDDMGNFIGFDLIIGNPPYLKEYTNRQAFDGFRETSPYYQGKMDLWYGFACYALDLLKKNGILSFIATSNWISSAGASKLRSKIRGCANFLQFIDFGTYMIFGDSASIQTMIMVVKKENSNANFSTKFSRNLIHNSSLSDIIQLLNGNADEASYGVTTFERNDKDVIFSFEENTVCAICAKMRENASFLEERMIAQGIIGAPDEAFIISNPTIFSTKEQQYIKPYYTGLKKKYILNQTDKFIIYLSAQNFSETEFLEFDGFSSHFEPYKNRLIQSKIKFKTPQKPYYYLHRERKESFFKAGTPRLITQGRTHTPIFVYTEDDCYPSRSLFVITSNKFNLKYLCAILNSKLIAFWLRNKGKMQGACFQVDKGPLLSIPIQYKNEYASVLINLIDQIITSNDYDASVSSIASKIDIAVYHLYDLTYDEVLIVDPGTLISREEYESFNLDAYGQS